ncbi:MAG: nitroreductase [Planctomycetota bacterium]|jgi:nitroreductase|nr:nitroreductase [Planctomycetota bacterium]
MNEVIKAILERRSVRAYRDDPVERAHLEEIVRAGLYAPSARNTQAWHVSVVRDRAKIEELGRELKAAIIRGRVEQYLALANSPEYRMGFGAPVFMIVSADPDDSPCPKQDSALVLGNMFLAAHSLGVGSCWVNQLCPVTDDPAFRQKLDGLGVPPSHKVYGAAAFGYNAGAHPRPPIRRENTVSWIG